MYETGMFRACMTSEKMNKLVCIHHESASLPHAIDEYQSVVASHTRLFDFLDGLFRNEDPLPGRDPLNPELSDKTLKSAADRIAAAFRPPIRPVPFNYHVALEVRELEKLVTWEGLRDCRIETDLRTADLFGKVEPPSTWGELISNIMCTNNTNKWLVELHAVLIKAGQRNMFRPISGTFECRHGGRVMRPVLHSMEHDGIGGDYKFHFSSFSKISGLLQCTAFLPLRSRCSMRFV